MRITRQVPDVVDITVPVVVHVGDIAANSQPEQWSALTKAILDNVADSLRELAERNGPDYLKSPRRLVVEWAIADSGELNG